MRVSTFHHITPRTIHFLRAGISAATTLSPLVDYADLDGHVLIANDPYDGIQIVDGKLTLVDKPGTGVSPL